MRGLAILLFVLFCTSCSSVRVVYDYDKATQFSNYTTYGYYPDMETGMSQLDARRLLNAVDEVMQQKGILFSEEPDLLINIQSRDFRTPQNSNVGVGVGGTSGNVGGGVSIGIPLNRPNVEREIVFDLIDSQKDMLVWQAISDTPFREGASPSVKEEKLYEIVNKVFSKYPPSKSN